MPCVEDDIPISISMETNSDVNQERMTTNERNADERKECRRLLASMHRTPSRSCEISKRSPLSNTINLKAMITQIMQEFLMTHRDFSTGKVQPSTFNINFLNQPARLSATMSPQHPSGYCKTRADNVPDKKPALDFPLGSICLL